MGTPLGMSMAFNLVNFFTRTTDLSYLVDPFSSQEIDDLVKRISIDKALGPDGFNGYLLEKCWPIIVQDFYRLIAHFHAGCIDIQPLNSSFITLVPKKTNLETANDFRPISLMNISLKLLTKAFVDRLQGVITKLIHQNQYSFIKGRTIQDCLAWAFEYIHQCQQSNREIVIIKLDFEKAFDSIEHEAILMIMRHMGFPAKWLSWVDMIFNSTCTSVLLNRVPGMSFKCKRRVRQGDPLSPLLFVLGVELLQAILNRACQLGLISKPIRPDDESDFLVIQYANDAIILMKADQKEFFCLKALLNTFAQSTCLKINFHKSNIYPLNMDEQKVES